jgi:glycosyltransferase involved in cell wall biosynthesis
MTTHCDEVLILQRRLTAYRVPLFERLRASLDGRGVRLNLVYGAADRAERARGDEAEIGWAVRAPCRYVGFGGARLSYLSVPPALLCGASLVILTHEARQVGNYKLIIRRGGAQPKLAFWGHGANFQQRGGEHPAEAVKGWASRRADWWFAYTPLSVDRVMGHGFPADRITCLNNTIDTEQARAWGEEVTREELDRLRGDLGIEGRTVAACLGSLAPGKALDLVFASADAARERLPSFELLIIGDGPLRGEVRREAERRPFVRWVGAKHGREKAALLKLCRFLLNPGMVGLAIVDGFALGLPMVTTSRGDHSPEIAYLRPGENGLLCAPEPRSLAQAMASLFETPALYGRLAEGAGADGRRYTMASTVENFTRGIEEALRRPPRREGARRKGTASPKRVVVIWQRFLPYHTARLAKLSEKLAAGGQWALTAVEVASRDLSYAFPESAKTEGAFQHVCCFPNQVYHRLRAGTVRRRVLRVLESVQPDAVFAPAAPFPEGMAAYRYGLRRGVKTFLMDDAWEWTDRRGRTVKTMKRLIYRCVDGALVPAPSHRGYYESLGFPAGRIAFGVDAVDNHFYAHAADDARAQAASRRAALRLPEAYFLWVGRFLPRKGLETLLEAYGRVREERGEGSWSLVLVGDGPWREQVARLAGEAPGVVLAGPLFGEELCACYALAKALVVPSFSDPWGLVINEGLASGVPVIASEGAGATATLVRAGVNGWRFTPGDVEGLARALGDAQATPPETLRGMGEAGRKIVAEWGLDRFAQGVLDALALPKREPPGLFSRVATRLWPGRVKVY